MTYSFHDKSCGSGPGSSPVPYVLGTARGVRSFEIDHDGILRGVTYPQPWLEGENIAQCYVTKRREPLDLPSAYSFIASAMMPHSGQYLGNVGGVLFPPGLDEPVLNDNYEYDDCGGVSKTCACGFYAYHKDLESYYSPRRAVGVIEAYGRVILGGKGFRAQKARIVGLVLPTTESDIEEQLETWQNRIDQVNQVLDRIPEATFRFGRTTKGIAGLAVASLVAGILSPAPTFLSGAITGSLIGLTFFAESHIRTAQRRLSNALVAARTVFLAQMKELASRRNFEEQRKVDLVRKNYPSIPVFDSLKELLEAYPTTDLGYLADPRQEHPEA